MKTNSTIRPDGHTGTEVMPASNKVRGKAKTDKKANAMDEVQRHHEIEVAAYFLAERRGFAADGMLNDWLFAEAQFAGEKPQSASK
mgnify:CR=1 FL=1